MGGGVKEILTMSKQKPILFGDGLPNTNNSIEILYKILNNMVCLLICYYITFLWTYYPSAGRIEREHTGQPSI